MKALKKTGAVVLSAVMVISAISVPAGAKTTVKLNKKEVSLTVGKSVTLKVTGTKQKVSWSTSDKKVASVTVKGKVTAKSEGSAVIRARVTKKTLKCKVKVTAPAVKPLSTYWSADSATAESLREYVAKVTDEKDTANYIPVKDRIAVFDMDGTLTCETFFTYFDTMMFIEYCLKDHPEKVSDDLKKAATEIKPGYKAGEELARNFARAYAGMTIQDLYDYAVQFGNKYTASFNNMRYFDGFYLPMVEVVKYLYDNDFTVYVVSGTERTTTRAIVANSPIADYVTPNHIIGTEFEVKVKGNETVSSNMDFKYVDGDELVFTGGFIQKDLNACKTIWIEREIGQRPVLAFGNSGSDTSMLNYAIDKRNTYPTEAYMVVADDSEREWGTEDWEKKSADYIAQGYHPVSMKTEFANIYPEGITKAETQATAA
ncbi:MAG: haloacid dehalogenase-like hydrolase [Eubacterium sp.]|nr:haloacid dehalogenase-like hydrolase [Eubacterium sp.]